MKEEIILCQNLTMVFQRFGSNRNEKNKSKNEWAGAYRLADTGNL